MDFELEKIITTFSTYQIIHLLANNLNFTQNINYGQNRNFDQSQNVD